MILALNLACGLATNCRNAQYFLMLILLFLFPYIPKNKNQEAIIKVKKFVKDYQKQ